MPAFSDQQLLHMAITEHVAPGQMVHLYLEAPREISAMELASLESFYREKGLTDVAARFGSTADWPNALYLRFRRPKQLGPQFLQLVLIVLAGAALLGFGSLAGWKIGSGISNNLVPIMIIGATASVLVALVISKGNASYKADIAVRR